LCEHPDVVLNKYQCLTAAVRVTGSGWAFAAHLWTMRAKETANSCVVVRMVVWLMSKYLLVEGAQRWKRLRKEILHELVHKCSSTCTGWQTTSAPDQRHPLQLDWRHVRLPYTPGTHAARTTMNIVNHDLSFCKLQWHPQHATNVLDHLNTTLTGKQSITCKNKTRTPSTTPTPISRIDTLHSMSKAKPDDP
jgi:hypothetical protein